MIKSPSVAKRPRWTTYDYEALTRIFEHEGIDVLRSAFADARPIDKRVAVACGSSQEPEAWITRRTMQEFIEDAERHRLVGAGTGSDVDTHYPASRD